MTTKRFGNKNATIITLDDGTIILQSYQTKVAAILPDGTAYRTSMRWSVTTSKQTSQFFGKFASAIKSYGGEKPQHYFDHAIG